MLHVATPTHTHTYTYPHLHIPTPLQGEERLAELRGMGMETLLKLKANELEELCVQLGLAKSGNKQEKAQRIHRALGVWVCGDGCTDACTYLWRWVYMCACACMVLCIPAPCAGCNARPHIVITHPTQWVTMHEWATGTQGIAAT